MAGASTHHLSTQTIVIKEASGKVKERVKPLGDMRVTARRVLFADLILKY